MKRILKITILAFAIMLFNSFRNTASAQYDASVSYQTFYDDLSPYGQWIDYPDYGYVWYPNVGADFQPYSTMGHWEWSDDYDWIWVSDYDWGWAPFHYGRWFYDPAYGWLWVPGYDWSPAWVAWRSGGDFYGWAPLGPSVGFGFSLMNYAPPIDYWCFVPRLYITSPRIYDYYVSRRNNFMIVNNTTIINNYNFYGGRGRNVFVNGPRRDEVEGYIHTRIRSVDFRESSRPGRTEFRNNELSMYRPNVQRNNNGGMAPRNFTRYNSQPRGDNGYTRNDNINRRGNNLPDRRNNNPNFQNNRNNNNSFDRQRQLPYNSNNNINNQRTGRQNNDNFNRNPFTNNNNNNNNQRVNPFERNNQQRSNNWNNRNQQPQVDRRPTQSPVRQFERRDAGSSNHSQGNSNSSGRSGGGRRRG